ncbi:hypothetical protein TNCV_2179231 [Trichonephila clavipes]|uniref:Uncharacterized protein n=1 Tax=Trichonephila clavipes TaxID=2585209 RepID=A0A8X6VUG9_TRICX|nr:hypothetical protein TNCV_2179231 [Trichonephila clavipes]
MDFEILNHGQVKRMTPELASPSPNFHTTPTGGRLSVDKFNVHQLLYTAGLKRVSASDKGWWVYPLDPHPDSISLYSGCTLGKCRVWYLPDDRHIASLVGLRGGWRHSRMKTISLFMDPEISSSGKGLV